MSTETLTPQQGHLRAVEAELSRHPLQPGAAAELASRWAQHLPAEASELAKAVQERLGREGAVWLQPGADPTAATTVQAMIERYSDLLADKADVSTLARLWVDLAPVARNPALLARAVVQRVNGLAPELLKNPDPPSKGEQRVIDLLREHFDDEIPESARRLFAEDLAGDLAGALASTPTDAVVRLVAGRLTSSVLASKYNATQLNRSDSRLQVQAHNLAARREAQPAEPVENPPVRPAARRRPHQWVSGSSRGI